MPEEIQSDTAPLQKIDKLLSDMESEFADMMEKTWDAEAKRQADFQTMQETQRKKMREYIETVKERAINSALSSETENSAVQPPTTPFNGTVDLSEYEKFAKHPYFIYPGGRNTVYVVVPKFFPSFQVGWLKDEIDGVWNRYEVNQYAILFGSVPEQIRKHINMPDPIQASIEGNNITFSPDDKKTIKRRLAKHVTDWTDGGARITKGNEYAIIDQILQSGHIPFIPRPVKDEHIVDCDHTIKLRAYQNRHGITF